MKIIDAHHHLWNPVSNVPDIGYVWLKKIGAPKPFGDPTPIQRDYLFDEYRDESKKFEIVGSVHVQCDGAIPDPVRETGFVHDIADRTQFPMAIVGFVDLTADDAPKTIERHRGSDHFRGVRQILSKLDDRPDISFAAEHYVRDPKWRDQFGLLAEHALSFDLQCYPEQMAELAEFLAKHPHVPVVIDHTGSPYDQTEEGLRTWRGGMAQLSELQHVSAKISGLGMFDAGWSVESAQPIIETMFELFGPDRLMFGSNFPVDKLMRSYDDTISDIKTITDTLGPAAAEKVFFSNARDFYGMDL